MNSELNLNDVFSALAHPVRRDMVKRLAQGQATVNDLAAPFDMSLPAISKHIKVLEHAGLIERGKDAQFRPCQLNPSALHAVATWADAYRPIWEARFDQMDRILQSKRKTTMEDNTAWARIERSFDAPIAQVWDMWTQPEKFQQWYGPMGATLPVCEMDLTVGGIRKTCMEMQMGDRTMQMWFTGVFKEINAPTRLVYTEAMCDAEGNLLLPSAMGMPGDTPNITEVIVDLRADGDTTHLTMVHKGVPEGSPGEKGWGMAIDKLAGVLG